MKILFVTLTRYDEPLGIMYLSAVLKKNGNEVRGVMMEREDIFKVIEEFKPDLVGYSGMVCEKNKILDINSKLKEEHNFFSIIGGPLATFSHEIIEDKYVDALCIGEGEEAMLELVNKIEKKEDIRDIQNIFVKVNGEIYRNDLRPLIEDVDSIPFPDRTIFKNFKEGKLYNVVSSRGCPFNCTYCYNKKYKKMYEGKGKIVRHRSVDNVISEMKGIVANLNPSVFWFKEDHFYLELNLLKEFAMKYKEEVNKPFICSLRPEVLTNEEIVKTLKEANCVSVFTGCEAGNDDIRRDILKRNITKEQIIRAAELSNKYGIKIVFQNMIGIPSGNFEDDLETLELNIMAKPYYAWASICTPYPGTELYSIAKEKGLIDDQYENEFQETYHFKSSLKIPHASKVNVLHKIFALVLEYPDLFQVIKEPDFYKDIDDDKIKKLKEVFDSFKKYKYDKFENQDVEFPKIVTDFVDETLNKGITNED